MKQYLCTALAAALLIAGVPTAQAAEIEDEITAAEANAMDEGYVESAAPHLFPWLKVEDHRRAMREGKRVLAWGTCPEISVEGDDYPVLKRALRLWSLEQQRSLEQSVDQMGTFARDFKPAAAYYDYTVVERWGRIDDRIVSFALRNVNYSGGAHPQHWIVTKNLNVQTGEEISIDEIVNGREILLNALADAFRKQYPNRENDLFEQDVDKALDDYHIDANWQEYINWMLDARGDLVVFYNPYELGSYAAGTFELKVPRDVYPEVFRVDW